jgi:transforming growth factor-beta-induced protein
MRSNKIISGVALFAIASLVTMPADVQASSCGSKSATHASYQASPDIVDTAVAAGSFETLVAAVKAAGLVETLKGEGPYTVFAPTDEAFAKLPDGTVESLLKQPDRLRAILLYHVVPGEVKAADVVKLTEAKTALGQRVAVDAKKGVRINDAQVIQADIATSNGVIHVIDTVLIPENDIIEVARNAGSFKTLLAAVDAAGLQDVLRSEGPFTVFAPTDAAFAKLPKGTVESLLENPEQLKAILTYHVVSGEVRAADVMKLKRAKTVQGQEVRVNTESGVQINDAHVIKADVEATNGVIHVIDTVLIPQ